MMQIQIFSAQISFFPFYLYRSKLRVVTLQQLCEKKKNRESKSAYTASQKRSDKAIGQDALIWTFGCLGLAVVQEEIKNRISKKALPFLLKKKARKERKNTTQPSGHYRKSREKKSLIEGAKKGNEVAAEKVPVFASTAHASLVPDPPVPSPVPPSAVLPPRAADGSTSSAA